MIVFTLKLSLSDVCKASPTDSDSKLSDAFSFTTSSLQSFTTSSLLCLTCLLGTASAMILRFLYFNDKTLLKSNRKYFIYIATLYLYQIYLFSVEIKIEIDFASCVEDLD